ncbi:MAG: Hpt domain-containing protein, partial [Chloroflexota bacterium]|nr:Hpt domain-containing protein [Chloroflexota bacterium]
KPLQVQELFATIDSLVPPAAETETDTGGQGIEGRRQKAEGSRDDLVSSIQNRAPSGRSKIQNLQEPVLDRNVALDRVQGDRELLQEIVELFFEETPALRAQIKEAMARRDAKVLERAAHTLKSSVGTFGAKAAFGAALRLEMVGRSGDLADAEAAYAELEAELARLEPALAALREESLSYEL